MPAELIRNPFARLAPIIEVQHRSHGIDSQDVDMVAIQPKQGAVQQKIPYLDPAVIEDAAMPLRVVAQAGIGMVVQMGPVELGKSVRIVREMRRSPVHQDADSRLMGRIDEGHEILRRAVSARHGEKTGGVEVPWAGKRMLRPL